MYRKKLMKKVGSLVIVTALIVSAFAVFPREVTRASAFEGETIVVTEIMYNPAGADTNEWIELFNPSSEALNVSGWTIKDEADNTFGDLTGIVIPAYGYYVVYDSNILNNGPETIYIYDATATEVLNVSYDDIAGENQSIEIDEAEEWNVGPAGGTPGEPNSVMEAPVTTHELEGEETAWGWFVSNVTVTLNATDDTGVKETKYSIDGGAWNTYTEPFVIEEPGVHNVEYYSVDFWGVEETHHTVEVKIANTSSGLSVTPTEANWNETKTIKVYNAEGTVYLYAPREDTPRQGPDTGGYIEWFNILFDVSGKWWVVDTFDSEVNAFAIDVKPVELAVNATPDEVNYVKSGVEGSYLTIEGTVTMNGEAAAQAKVKLIYPDGSSEIKDVETDGSFLYHFNMGQKGAGEYNVTAYIGNATYPDAFGYDVVIVNVVAPNITLVSNDAVGGFDIGTVVFEVAYPEDGEALLANDHNISIYKDGELYAWHTKKGATVETGGPVNFAITGKLLNLTSGMWEAGDYVINFSVDVTGDGNWEYVGQADYTVQAAPPVNLKVEPKKIDVLEPANNKQVIQVQIFGENMTTYGTPEALGIGTNNENVTERIKVEGDVLYAPPKEAYEYWKDGIWNITIFPTRGKGEINVYVTWPDKGEANESIEVDKGGFTSVEPTTLIVDTPTTVEVEVKDKTEQYPIYNANVTIVYEDDLYGIGTVIATTNTVTGEKYVFTNFTSTIAGVNLIVMVTFEYGGETLYAYARIISNPAHDLNVSLAPSNVLAGENTEFTVNITRDGNPYEDTFNFYVLNATELQKLHDGTLELPAPVHTGTKANDTFNFLEIESGTYYVYVRTGDKKHDNMNNEPSFEVSKASVSVTPSLLVKNVDKDKTLDFTVTWNGEPVNGTLLIKGIKEVASFEAFVENETYELEIKNGEGNITNVTAIAVGNITFEFLPEADGSQYAEADGILEVTKPEVEIVEPAEKVAFLAEENLITILVKHPLTGSGVAGLKVKIITPTRADAVEVGETDENGKLLFGIVPLQTGKIKILVEDELAGEIDIWIGLKIIVSTEIEQGKNVTLLITTRGGKPVQGAKVTIEGKTLTTDANGEVKYKFENKGDIKITAEKDGYYPAEKTIKVVAGPSGPGFEFIGIALAVVIALFFMRRRK